MREIDQVRITLLRMFRGAVQLPQEIIDEMLKAFLHTQDAAIKVQAYGRGLLQRFRNHRLITKDFNRQASWEYQCWLKYRLPRTVGLSPRLKAQFLKFAAPFGFLQDVLSNDSLFMITEDFDGINAIFETRAHRMTRKRGEHGTISPWLAGRFTRFVKSRLYWRAHRSRLGVKLLDFGAG